MKRLAAIVIVATLGVAGASVARADPPGNARQVCRQRAETTVRTGVDEMASVEAGIDLRREAPRLSTCYRIADGFISHGPFAGVISVWGDPEHGRAGASCTKHKTWTDLGCGHHSVVLPAQATTPVGHPDDPWGVHALGIDLGYAFDSATASVAASTRSRCVNEHCAPGAGRSVTVRHGVQDRALGWECTAEESNCTASGRSTGATVGEQDEEPTVTDGTLSFDVPAVCVEVSTDPIC